MGANISSPGSVFDINALTADTPATADFIPFYDTSGGDSNKSTIANMQIAFWQTAPNVAHVKTDGTGSHATIVAANADASIVTIILYPGTHSVDNSAGFITLTKTIMSFGGKNRATISRTTNTNVCFRVTSNSVQIQGVGFSGGTSGNPFFLEIQTPATFTQAIYSDIQLAAGINGILVRTANGVSLEKITGFTTTTSIQVGDASSSFAPTVIIRNCGLAAFNVAAVSIYQCARCDITASSIISGTATGSTGVSILSTCTGDVNSTACTFADSENHIIHEGSGIYTSSADTFKNHSFGAVNSTAGTGTVIMNGSTISYDPIGFGNTDFALATSTTLKGYYFDAYIGELINVADSRSYRDISNLRWAFMFGGNT
jgi:hypothetical protein